MDLPLRAEDAPPHLLRNHAALLGVAGQVARVRLPPQGVVGTSPQHPIVVDDGRSTEACGPLLSAEPSVQQLLGDTAFVSVLHELLPQPSTRRPSQPPSSSRYSGHTSDSRSVVSSSSTSSTRSRLRDRIGHRRRIAVLSDSARDSAKSSRARPVKTPASPSEPSALRIRQDASSSLAARLTVPNVHTASPVNPYNILPDDFLFAPSTPTLSYSDSTTASPVSAPSELFDDFSQLLQSMDAGTSTTEPVGPQLSFGPSESLLTNNDDDALWALLQSAPALATTAVTSQPVMEPKSPCPLPEVTFDWAQFLQELDIPAGSEPAQDTGYC